MKDADFLRTAGKTPWRLVPTQKRNPESAVVYDAEGRLVVTAAYGNAELIVKAVTTYSEETSSFAAGAMENPEVGKSDNRCARSAMSKAKRA